MEQLILLMAQQQGSQGKGGSNVSFLLMMGLIMVVFYFFMIRPQQKKQKEIQKFRAALKKGDKIITSGGIYGKINDISGNVITVEVEDKMRIKVDVSAVNRDPSDIQQKQ